MLWNDAETAIRSQIETQWALSAYASMSLSWDNEVEPYAERYMAIMIEGIYAEKTIYGSVGKRSSVEAGIVFFHAFTPTGSGKSEAAGAVQTMTGILELRVLSNDVRLEGGNPPSPVEHGSEIDRALPGTQPHGNYYRCSGSVPFIVIDTR